MAAPTMLFLTYNEIDNRWKVVDDHQFPFGDGETPEEAIASARLVSDATIFSDSEPDVIVNRVFNKLFLVFQNDGKFHIIDDDGHSWGEAYEIPDAIKQVRKITESPIDFGDSHAGFERVMVTAKTENAEEDSEVFIQMLAELAGMKIRCAYDNQFRIIGYTMEPKDQELREFLAAEHAAEKLEDEIVGAMGSYMEDE